MDERQHEIVGTASTIATLVTFFYLLAEITYKFITTKNILNCGWEIVLIMIISVIFFIVMRLKKEMDIPKTFFGKILTTELTKEARKIRIKTYLLNSLFFALSVTVISLVFTLITESVESLSTLAAAGEFFGLFVISAILSYFWYEYQVKAYNKYIDNLEK